MELIKAKTQVNGSILIAGCLHVGAANCSWSALEKLISRAKNKDVIGILLTGDLIEGKLPAGKHFGRPAIDMSRGLLTPQDQSDALVELLKPVASKILSVGIGNHELASMPVMDVGDYVASKLGVPYGRINYKFTALDNKGVTRYKIHIQHGYGRLRSGAKDAIQRKANQEAALRQKYFGSGISDCILHAGSHWHRQIVSPPTYLLERHLIDDGESLKIYKQKPMPQNLEYIDESQRWVVSVGCFRKGYAEPDSGYFDYAELSLYHGVTDLGYTEVVIRDYQVSSVIPVSFK